MKISYDDKIFKSHLYGGIARYFFELANRIANYGYDEVEIVSPAYVTKYLSQASPALKIKGYRVPRFRGSWILYGLINNSLSGHALKLSQPDVLHQTYYSSINRPSPKTKIIVTVHDLIHDLYPNLFSPNDLTSHNMREAVTKADHVICVSENTRSDLIRLMGVEPSRTTVIYHGTSLHDFGEFRPILQRPYLLYVGSRSGYKNFDTFLQAFATNSKLRNGYTLVAFGGGKFSSAEIQRIAELRLDLDSVLQYDGGDDVLANLYQHADLLIYPSLYEGFGMPLLEAMNFGCPVVCSNSSSLPEVVGDAAVFFEPKSCESISSTIENVLGDSSLVDTLVTRGRNRAKLFSWDRCAQETRAVYKMITDN